MHNKDLEKLHYEIKAHIAQNRTEWERLELKYGETLIKPGDIITKTYYIEKGILKLSGKGKFSHENIIVNLFSENNPCMPLSLYEGVLAEFYMVAIGKENIVYAIDIKELREAQEKTPELKEVLEIVLRNMRRDLLDLRDLAAVKPFHKHFICAMEKFPCLANMNYEDVLDFFRVDDKTLEKELEKIAQHPHWISSISDVIVKKIEEMTNKK